MAKKKEEEQIPVDLKRFVAIYARGLDRKLPAVHAFGIHGYLCSTLPIKRGYGLKQVRTTPKGYVTNPDLIQTTVEQVFDFRMYRTGVHHEAGDFLLGIARVLNDLVDKLKDRDCLSICLVTTESKKMALLKSGLPYMATHNYKNRQGQEVPYRTEAEACWAALKKVEDAGIIFEMVQDEGTDNIGAVAAKLNAETALTWGIKVGAVEDTNSALEESPPERYWNYAADRDPFLNKSRLVFVTNTVNPRDTDFHYLIDFDQVSKKKDEHHKREIEVGQRLPTAALSVIKKVGIDPVIAQVVDEQVRYTPAHEQRMGVMFLKNLYSPKTHKLVSDTGARYLRPDGLVLNLLAPNDDPVTHELYPPRQALRLLHDYAELESILKAVLRAHDEGIIGSHAVLDIPGYGDAQVTHVTKKFYTVTEDAKGKSICKLAKAADIPNSKITLDTVYPHLKEAGKVQSIGLAIGIDTPIRNAMAAMAGEETEVYFVTNIVSERLIAYQTVFVTSEGSGIFTGHYCRYLYSL